MLLHIKICVFVTNYNARSCFFKFWWWYLLFVWCGKLILLIMWSQTFNFPCAQLFKFAVENDVLSTWIKSWTNRASLLLVDLCWDLKYLLVKFRQIIFLQNNVDFVCYAFKKPWIWQLSWLRFLLTFLKQFLYHFQFVFIHKDFCFINVFHMPISFKHNSWIWPTIASHSAALLLWFVILELLIGAIGINWM